MIHLTVGYKLHSHYVIKADFTLAKARARLNLTQAQALRAGGAFFLAITNSPDSPLARRWPV